MAYTMPPPPAAPPARSWLRWLWEEERVGLPIALAMAAFLTILLRGEFWENLVYSLCIGQLIQFSIEAGRHGMSRWQRRGLPPEPDERAWPGWAFMAPWILVCAAGGYWLGMHLADWITGQQHAAALRRGEWRILGPILAITLAVSVLTTHMFYTRGRLALMQAEAEAAQRAAAENQLRLLQSQLEPHMLFNTLANLRVLIGIDPPRAQAMLDQLVNFLRSTLQASRAQAHPLADEFARAADYLALMQVRMGPRLQVALNLPEGLRDTPVPPLLLQPLVENSIKHGLEPQREGGRITLGAEQQGQALVLTVHDTGAGLSAGAAAAGTGFGLEQVRQRLRTLHGEGATLELQPGPAGGTLARITLPLPT